MISCKCDFGLIFQALDAHVVSEILTSERYGNESRAGTADVVAVHDCLGGFDPRDHLDLTFVESRIALEFADEPGNLIDILRFIDLAD